MLRLPVLPALPVPFLPRVAAAALVALVALAALAPPGAQAQAAASAPGNLFDEPFLQVSRGLPRCPVPRGPWWTPEEAVRDAHWRTQSGVSCHLAGKCRLMNSYQYDAGIAERAARVAERDDRFAAGSVWLHVSRRIVTAMGCVRDEGHRQAVLAALQGIDDVNAVVDQLMVGENARPPYALRR